ncbi:hypothetical protein [Noviherbaspirillum massiliense]|uniref:hypothetical protein n=1 Tax=Noviherbaspirillum massiliense TaxID=1465823 RepID=UPI00094694EC|nr:hypothetical protein [Noviherbaspirillum massiliense]
MEMRKGDFVEYDGLPAVVVGIYGDAGVPEEHVALWFGANGIMRKSEGGMGGVVPEVWTVPVELCSPGIKAIFKH